MIAISPTAPMTMPTIAPVLSFEDEALDEEGVPVDPAVLGALVLDWEDCPLDAVAAVVVPAFGWEDCPPDVAEVGVPD